VQVAVLDGVRPEELRQPRVGQVLHAHAVHLGRLARGPAQFLERQVAGQVGLQRVPELVGEDVHVVRGAVEVAEDERQPDPLDEGAVAARLLAGLLRQVQVLGLEQQPEERARLRRQLVVHRAGALGEPLLAALRARVPRGELDRHVVEGEPVEAEACALLIGGRHCEGHDVLQHARAEALHLGRTERRPAHPVVAHRDEVGVAERARHAVAHRHELVVEAIEFGGVVGEEPPGRLLCGLPGGAVRVLGERAQPGQRVRLAAERDLGTAQQLVVGGDEPVLERQVVHDRGAEHPLLQRDAVEEVPAEPRLEVGPERAVEQQAVEPVVELLQPGPLLVEEVLLGGVERIGGVHRVPDGRDLRGGGHRLAQRLVLQERLPLALERAGGREPVEDRGRRCRDLLQIGALVGDLAELHGCSFGRIAGWCHRP